MKKDIFLRQALDVSSIGNARQLGGYLGSDGRVIKKNLLLRTAGLSEASKEDLEKLKTEYHVTQVVDFRTEEERQAMPDQKIEGAVYTSICVMNLDDSTKKQFQNKMEIQWNEEFVDAILSHLDQIDMKANYEGQINSEMGQAGYREFFRILKEQKPGEAVLWHCTQGKDRTGLASLFLLSALGVDEKTILMDYELSNVYYDKKVKALEKLAAEKGYGAKTIEQIQAMIGVNREVMEYTLKVLKEKYGSVEQYLHHQLGVTDEDIQELKEKYLQR